MKDEKKGPLDASFFLPPSSVEGGVLMLIWVLRGCFGLMVIGTATVILTFYDQNQMALVGILSFIVGGDDERSDEPGSAWKHSL